MSGPVRIQRKRTRGYRMPPNSVSVARPSVHGNKYRVGVDGDAAECVAKFKADWDYGLAHALGRVVLQSTLAKLRGKNLGCFCHLCVVHKNGKPFDVECGDCAPCHADPLGLLANAESRPHQTAREGR